MTRNQVGLPDRERRSAITKQVLPSNSFFMATWMRCTVRVSRSWCLVEDEDRAVRHKACKGQEQFQALGDVGCLFDELKR